MSDVPSIDIAIAAIKAKDLAKVSQWAKKANACTSLPTTTVANSSAAGAVLGINVTDALGNTALHWACNRGQGRMAAVLLSKGALPNLHNKNGATAVHCAAFAGSASTLEVLLRHGGDPTCQNCHNDDVYAVVASRNNRNLQDVLHRFDKGELAVASPDEPTPFGEQETVETTLGQPEEADTLSPREEGPTEHEEASAPAQVLGATMMKAPKEANGENYEESPVPKPTAAADDMLVKEEGDVPSSSKTPPSKSATPSKSLVSTTVGTSGNSGHLMQLNPFLEHQQQPVDQSGSGEHLSARQLLAMQQQMLRVMSSLTPATQMSMSTQTDVGGLTDVSGDASTLLLLPGPSPPADDVATTVGELDSPASTAGASVRKGSVGSATGGGSASQPRPPSGAARNVAIIQRQNELLNRLQREVQEEREAKARSTIEVEHTEGHRDIVIDFVQQLSLLAASPTVPPAQQRGASHPRLSSSSLQAGAANDPSDQTTAQSPKSEVGVQVTSRLEDQKGEVAETPEKQRMPPVGRLRPQQQVPDDAVVVVHGEKHLPGQPQMLLVQWKHGEQEAWVPVDQVAHCDAVVAYFARLGATISPGPHTPANLTNGAAEDEDEVGPTAAIAANGGGGGYHNRDVGSPLGDTEREELAQQLRQLKRLGTANASRDSFSGVYPPSANEDEDDDVNGDDGHVRVGGVVVSYINEDGTPMLPDTYQDISEEHIGVVDDDDDDVLPPPPRRREDIDPDLQPSPFEHPENAEDQLARQYEARLAKLEAQHAAVRQQRREQEERIQALKAKQQLNDTQHRREVHAEYEEKKEILKERQPWLQHPLMGTNDQHAALLLHQLHEEISVAERERDIYDKYGRKKQPPAPQQQQQAKSSMSRDNTPPPLDAELVASQRQEEGRPVGPEVAAKQLPPPQTPSPKKGFIQLKATPRKVDEQGAESDETYHTIGSSSPSAQQQPRKFKTLRERRLERQQQQHRESEEGNQGQHEQHDVPSSSDVPSNTSSAQQSARDGPPSQASSASTSSYQQQLPPQYMQFNPYYQQQRTKNRPPPPPQPTSKRVSPQQSMGSGSISTTHQGSHGSSGGGGQGIDVELAQQQRQQSERPGTHDGEANKPEQDFERPNKQQANKSPPQSKPPMPQRKNTSSDVKGRSSIPDVESSASTPSLHNRPASRELPSANMPRRGQTPNTAKRNRAQYEAYLLSGTTSGGGNSARDSSGGDHQEPHVEEDPSIANQPNVVEASPPVKKVTVVGHQEEIPEEVGGSY